ncbi:butyrophilin subfamily 1 member A1-like [Nelusetta ayraudi]|uniref:butyrophilin subfamily 1 member A1-like n=1 Tax=Nelusetta ayraudi TaxID=303726 RepID=UPI003F718E98
MRIILGVFLALVVSADDEGGVRVISGCLEETVLLPCACTHNLDMEFKWQMDKPRAILLLKYNNNILSLGDSYKGRAKMFLPEESNNCSVLLANITADDQGKYRCRFYDQKRHIKKFVYLNISANYSVCQTNNSNATVFRCNATGRHKDTVIEWRSDGRLLTDSAQTRITHNITSGLYHFSSELIATLKSPPTCNITAKGLSTVVSDGCTPTGEVQQTRSDPERTRHRYTKMISFILALGLCLVLWCQWKSFPGRSDRNRASEPLC